MRRGEFYRLRRPPNDTKPRRTFLIISRDEFIAAQYSTVVAVPVYSNPTGVKTEVPVGPSEGLAHASVLRCDELTSVPKARLTDYVGSLAEIRMAEVSEAIIVALAIDCEDL